MSNCRRYAHIPSHNATSVYNLQPCVKFYVERPTTAVFRLDHSTTCGECVENLTCTNSFNDQLHHTALQLNDAQGKSSFIQGIYKPKLIYALDRQVYCTYQRSRNADVHNLNSPCNRREHHYRITYFEE